MIITVTCNPAIDKTVYADHTDYNIGGKGINVSKVLKKLNTDSLATGFLGKENGQEVKDALDASGIEHHFIEIEGKVRTNTKLIQDGKLIEQNEKGPEVDENSVRQLFAYLSGFENEIVVISGSTSRNLDSSFYRRMVELLKKKGNYVILDCDGEMLKEGIKAKPDFIKPNKDEISAFFHIDYDRDEIIRRCKALNLENICISLGGEGALFIGKEIYEVEPLPVNFVSPVGAGDALVAGMTYGRYRNLDLKECIRVAIACASASVEMTGSIPPEYEHINDLIEKVEIRSVNL